MRLLLDTAPFIWAALSPERFTRRARAVFETTENILELSAISVAEIGIKQLAGKLQFSSAQVRQAVDDLKIHILPYTAEHAYHLFELPLHHRDPFDRQIITQAMTEKIAVLSPDQSFRLYEGLKVIW